MVESNRGVLFENSIIKLEQMTDNNIHVTFKGEEVSILIEGANTSVMMPDLFNVIWEKKNVYDKTHVDYSSSISLYKVESLIKKANELDTIKEAFAILRSDNE
jgi:hypothetical protein